MEELCCCHHKHCAALDATFGTKYFLLLKCGSLKSLHQVWLAVGDFPFMAENQWRLLHKQEVDVVSRRQLEPD